MKKIEENEMLLINGGIKWADFVDGFCDGLVIGELITGQWVAGLITDRACSAWGLGTKWFS
ncbi:hypothetical protein [Emticicia sp. SJ17W-69]|uniref:hypothetical protein n=1 Tax=Emticicia sp. SJ17W-69 TaxID=3421657 RepID=UPI003EB75877